MTFRILATTTLLALALGGIAPANAAPTHEVVGSKYDAKVQTKDGSCVRTRWQSGDDVCGTKKAPPAPAPIVEAAPYIPPAPQPVVQAPRPAPPVVRTVIKEEARTIYFDSGVDKLTKGGEKKLDSLTQMLIGAKDIERVDIVGHADPMGARSTNQALSERRAATVQSYLNQNGYMKTAIAKTKAVGEDQASANCDAKMKRAMKIGCLVTDRKVTVEVVYSVTQ